MTDKTLPDISIKVCSLRYADRLLKPGGYDALISIGHPNGTENCTRDAARTLRLNFYDDAPYWRRIRGLPTGESVLKIIDFARGLYVGTKLLVHCKAGRSRSTATALIVMASRGLSEEFAVEYLLKDNPKATPNGWLLKLADDLLDTELFDMCEEVGIVKWRRKATA